jgi:hypothetical protein
MENPAFEPGFFMFADDSVRPAKSVSGRLDFKASLTVWPVCGRFVTKLQQRDGNGSSLMPNLLVPDCTTRRLWL